MDQNNAKQHWEKIYAEKDPQEVSWFQVKPVISLEILKHISDNLDQIIDVGGGASVLVDHLLKLGYSKVAVLDISGKAIEHAKKRLRDLSDKVEWYEKDITQFTPPHFYDVWHDRAVFHFLTDKHSRESYLNALKNTIKSGSHVIIATFAKDGPKKCSGLNIVRYDSSSIQNEFGDEFILFDSQTENHITASGNEHRFNYFIFRRK